MICLCHSSRARAAALRVGDPGELALELAPGGDALRAIARARRSRARSRGRSRRSGIARRARRCPRTLPPVPSHRPPIADPGRVDEQRAAGQREQLARDRRVAPAPVGGADRAVAWRSSPRSALTSVDLPAPDRAEQDGGRARLEQLADDPEPRRRRGRSRRRASATPSRRASWAARPCSRPWRGRPWSAAERVGTPAGERQRGEAARAARTRVGQRLGDEREVDVRRQHLGGRAGAGRARTSVPVARRRPRSRRRRPSRRSRRWSAPRAVGRAPGRAAAGRHLGATSQRPRCCASTRARVSSVCNGGSPHQFARRTRRGAGTRRVGPEPVQAVVAKM